MTNKDMYEIVMRQLARDLNCDISDLQGTDNKTVVLTSSEPYNFCHLVCFRNKGVATILAKIITELISDKGIVPYSTLAWSNIASKNTLINIGYKSAWTAIGT